MHSAPLPGIDTCSRYHCATISPPIKEVEHKALEGEAAEEEAADKSSAGSMEFVIATLWSSPVYLLMLQATGEVFSPPYERPFHLEGGNKGRRGRVSTICRIG